jgi:hypothetical protein
MSRKTSDIAYTTRDLAAFGGFCWVISHGKDWDKWEYGFFVLLTKSKPVEYRYSIPERGTETRAALGASKDDPIRAFCHTHPKSDTSGNLDFGGDDKDLYKKAVKTFPSIAFYLMNQFDEVRLAQSEQDFLPGRRLDFKSSSCPK